MKIDGTNAIIFDAPSRYDIIFGQDFCEKIGIDIKYTTRTMHWMNSSVSMKDIDHWDRPMHWILALEEEDDLYGEQHGAILDAKYEPTTPQEVTKAQQHLAEEQRLALERVLDMFPTVFDGTLKYYPHSKVHLDLEPGAVPVHKKAYPVPRMHDETFRKESQHLVDIGVLRRKEYKYFTKAKLTVFTEHENFLRWRLFLAVSDCTFKYIQGKENVLADCFSRLPTMPKCIKTD
jgi:hypothetical protein